jgi:hypothetical protein
LGELSLAMQQHLRLSDILDTIHAYPTMNTGLQQAAFEAFVSGHAARRNRKVVQTMLRLQK